MTSGAMKTLRCDNAPELKEGRSKKLCDDNGIYVPPTPPYTSETQGRIERQWRELRTLIRTAVSALGLRKEDWMLVVRGCAELKNKVWQAQLGKSPYHARFGLVPSLKFSLGDPLICKLPKFKEAKDLTLPGKRVLYLHQHNPHTAAVLWEGKVVRVHPADLRLPRAGVNQEWLARFEARKVGQAAQHPTPPARAVRFLLSEPSTRVARVADNRDGGDTDEEWRVPRRKREEAGAGDAGVAAVAEDGASTEEPVSVPPLAVDELAGQDAAVAAGGESRARCVLAYDAQGVLRAALVRKECKAKSHITWLEEDREGQWGGVQFDEVENRRIALKFGMESGNRLPALVVQRIGERLQAGAEEGEALFTTESPRGLSASSSFRSATEEDERQGRFANAKLLEFVTVLSNEVFGQVEDVPQEGTMDMRWHLTEKVDGAGQMRFKARWICRGFQSRRDCETYAGTPAWKNIRTVMVLAASRGWEMATVDVKGAFLQARTDDQAPIYVRLDDGMPRVPVQNAFPQQFSEEAWSKIRGAANELKPGQVRRLVKALYGDKQSPRAWKREFRNSAEALGFQEIAESVEIRRGTDLRVEEAMSHHVDDILLVAEKTSETLHEVSNVFECNAPQILSLGETVTFNGLELTHTQEGYQLSSDGYLAKQPPVAACARGMISDRQMEKSENEVIDLELKQEYASIVGRIGWAVTHTRPNQLVYFCRLSEYNQAPTARRLEVARRVLQGLQETPSSLCFRAVIGHPVLVGYSDAAYNGVTKQARLGFKVFLLGQENLTEHADCVNLIDWGTSRASRRVGSSSAAELFALKELVKQLFAHVDLVTELWGLQPLVRVRSDSAAVVQQVQKGSPQSEPGLQGELDYVIQETARLESVVEQVARKYQLADAMTKCEWFGRRE
eukprot:GHVU01210165.1.p1 GENE.GHVU01210165.1~~GHVU01210165.1.p1  ORF type:complete len:1037 (+),score=133.03 GHVU01210165.1:404-3112(+)